MRGPSVALEMKGNKKRRVIRTSGLAARHTDRRTSGARPRCIRRARREQCQCYRHCRGCCACKPREKGLSGLWFTYMRGNCGVCATVLRPAFSPDHNRVANAPHELESRRAILHLRASVGSRCGDVKSTYTGRANRSLGICFFFGFVSSVECARLRWLFFPWLLWKSRADGASVRLFTCGWEFHARSVGRLGYTRVCKMYDNV